mgnify:CR=1 FL=1
MKAKVIKIKKSLIISIVVGFSFLICIFSICFDQIDILSFETKEVASKIQINKVENIEIETNVEIKNNINVSTIKEKEYENFPKEYRGYKTVGKITIPKLNIEKYILEETTEQSLKVGVTKLCGPNANQEGNFCISGHNYIQTFGRLNQLEIGDKIIITDTYNRDVTYQVYKTYKVDPTDTSCLSQETNGEREITLITCTLGAIKRTIIKAIEVYD